ncbi:MAG TPA: DNA methyltransferase [Allosphingosinicella sp.]|nr:DNA methyltransferase [Allosphingosinicella sp.]
MNRLYFGDNLTVLREHVKDESVDLVYLDPPFNSRANYNVLFSDKRGEKSQAQAEAFQDTWAWGPMAEHAYDEVMRHGGSLAVIFSGLRKWRGDDPLMAYVSMMGVRLVELHRVLKPTGSLYLHCDPTASHYLKLLLDAVFGNRMRSEIVWKRSSAHSDGKQGARQPGRIHDTIFFYTKGDDWVWNPIFTPYDPEYLATEYKRVGADGRRYKETDLTAAKPGGDVSYEWRVKRVTDPG